MIRRTAASVALVALAIGPSAHAQVVSPSGGVSAYDIGQSGISVQADPQKGASLGVDAGENGSLTVGAGPQGIQAEVDPGSATLPGTGNESQSQSTPQASTGDGNAAQPSTPDADSPATSPAGPGGAAGTSPDAAAAAGAGTSEAPSSSGGRDGDRTSAARRADRESATERGTRGVAPVLDLIEKIPSAVWAALLSLGLIALTMWLMWVRGRRRLERNAWVDTDSPEMNVVAFETLLAQEWARSDRYRRPLSLLLLELEEPTSDGGRRPLTGKYRSVAQDAITAQARGADTVAQLSPSRFAVICPESSSGSAETLARALEGSLEAVRVHARVGTAGRLESDRGPADLVSRAAVAIDDQPTWVTPVIEPAAEPVPA
jgi:GGDEF domain-containing protein